MTRRKRLRSDLAWSTADRIVVRGHDLAEELIGHATKMAPASGPGLR